MDWYMASRLVPPSPLIFFNSVFTSWTLARSSSVLSASAWRVSGLLMVSGILAIAAWTAPTSVWSCAIRS